jgi:hypothetical protein
MEDTLEPGQGYWVKVSSPGTLVLNSGSMMLEPSGSRMPKSVTSGIIKKIPSQISSLGEINVLTISDALKRSAVLYFLTTAREIDQKLSELPPTPPPGSPHVRFGTNRMVETADPHSPKSIPISSEGMEYPLKAQWEMAANSVPASLTIDGQIVRMNGQGSIDITKPSQIAMQGESQLTLNLGPSSGVDLPKEFSIHQNYPNPFNPSTMIRYELPVESHVTLRIYNLVGQLVQTLIDESQEPGYKSVHWNAAEKASGVYYCRLQAGGNVAVIKLVLLR